MGRSKKSSPSSPPPSASQSESDPILEVGSIPTPTKTSNGDTDPQLLEGYQYTSQHTSRTPLDFMDDADGNRNGSFGKPAPAKGVSTVDLSQGVKSWHVLPPVAIWNKGKWWDQLSDDTQKAIRVNPADEREAWVVSGQGTPGEWLLRVYIVPIKVAEQQECKHPKFWTKKQREVGDDRPALTPVHTGGYGYGALATPSTPKAPSPPQLPSGIVMRCVGCGHWFDGETKLAGHTTHCCPGSDNWGTEGADWAIPCKCCDDWDAVAVCKPGFPRAKPEPAKKEDKKEADA
jgi:hypothetical protein